jgi:nucleoside-diphosphate-sugar epimerase
VRRVLITGGSGFIGTNLVQHFSEQGCELLNIDIREPRNGSHSRYWENVDLLDEAALIDRVVRFNPNIIFHMAARTDLEGKSLAEYAANTTGTQHLINAISECSAVERALFASSRLVCKIGVQPKTDTEYCPTTFYGESKAAGEEIVRSSDLLRCPWTIVRPTSIWGPWFDVPYKTFFLSIAANRYRHPSGINISKSFGYVGNTVVQLSRLASAPESLVNRRTTYLADYPPIDLREMANAIQREMNVHTIKDAPIALLRVAAKCGDLGQMLGWAAPPLTTFRLNNLVTNMTYDMSLLQQVSGDLPFTMTEGVRATVAWLNEQGELS